MSRPSPIRYDDSLDPFAKETQCDLPAYDPQADIGTAEHHITTITEVELKVCEAVDVAELVAEGVSPFTLTKLAVRAVASLMRLAR
ncbi:MAG: hypothetical protein ACO395_01975 [Pontimonas sp.]